MKNHVHKLSGRTDRQLGKIIPPTAPSGSKGIKRPTIEESNAVTCWTERGSHVTSGRTRANYPGMQSTTA